MVNLGDILVWGLRLSMLGICLYGLLTRKRFLFNAGVSGLGGSIWGWGMTAMILKDQPITGLFAVLFGLALIWFINGPTILSLLRRRRTKGYWIQINDQKFWIPPGASGVEIYLELIKTANPALKVEKTMAPRKGEKDEDYKDRMR